MAQKLAPIGPDSYVVSWSERQQCFHIETIEEMLLRNRRNFEHASLADFVPIAFAPSFKEANGIAEAYRQKRGIPYLEDQLRAGRV